MRASTVEARELLNKLLATRASVSFMFSSSTLAQIRPPRVPFSLEYDDRTDRLTLTGDGWSLEFVLSLGDLSTFRITEDEAESLRFKFPDGNLNVFAFKPLRGKEPLLQ
jgi:hypothetical protein